MAIATIGTGYKPSIPFYVWYLSYPLYYPLLPSILGDYQKGIQTDAIYKTNWFPIAVEGISGYSQTDSTYKINPAYHTNPWWLPYGYSPSNPYNILEYNFNGWSSLWLQ